MKVVRCAAKEAAKGVRITAKVVKEKEWRMGSYDNGVTENSTSLMGGIEIEGHTGLILVNYAEGAMRGALSEPNMSMVVRITEGPAGESGSGAVPPRGT